MAKKRRQREQAAAEAQALAATQAAQTNLSNNLKVNLQGNNSPDVQPSAVSAEGPMDVGGTSTKRRRATGALSSQLGVNV